MSLNKRKVGIGSLLSVALVLAGIPYAYGVNGGTASTPKAASSQSGTTADVSYQFHTNSFTRPDMSGGTVPSPVIPTSYRRVGENANLALFVDPSNAAIIIKNKETGYVWASIPPRRELRNEQLNSDWQASVESPLLVNYFTPDAMQNSGSFGSLGGVVEDFQEMRNGFSCRIAMTQIQATITMVVKLDKAGMTVTIPASGIQENGQDLLSTIQPYAFLGAVHEGDIPGYMFIPDGSGALIRFTNSHPFYDGPFSQPIFGPDASITNNAQAALAAATSTSGSTDSSVSGTPSGTTTPDNSTLPDQVSIPVFGVVQGINQNGFLGIVEKGQYCANVVAYPSGVDTNLNWVGSQFTLRNAYFQPTSANMGGYNTFQQTRVHTDMQIRYVFLSKTQANYVGMAKAYQSYLVQHGTLTQPPAAKQAIPLRVELLGAETKPGVFGSRVVDMTSFAQAQSIVGNLRAEGMRHIVVVYRGWNSRGLHSTPTFDVNASLGGTKGLAQFESYLSACHTPLYLYANFTDAYRNFESFNVKTDAARNIANQIVELPAVNPLETANSRLAGINRYYINPGTSRKIAGVDATQLVGLGIHNIAVDQTGSNLFSDYNPTRSYTRERAAITYESIANDLRKVVGGVAFYAPNEYILKGTHLAFDVPLSSSQYMYETDTVPFLQIVLHGYVDYFAPFSNFEADPVESLLRAIDYGAYPSFYLTSAPSWDLKGTPSENIFTSRYADWHGEIRAEYVKINDALRGVQGATLVDRAVPDWGIAIDKYSNGVTIIVNYRSSPVFVDRARVDADGFVVKGGN